MTNATDSGSQPQAAASSAARGALREVLSFTLGAEEYGIDILRVQEIRGYEQPTRIAPVAGHVNVETVDAVGLHQMVKPAAQPRHRLGMGQIEHRADAVPPAPRRRLQRRTGSFADKCPSKS